MKKFLSLLIIIFLFNTSFSQEISKLFAVGDSLYELDKYEEAQTIYEKILSFDENNPKVYDKLSNCLASQGDIDSAKVLLNKALEVDPKYAEGYAGLSNLFFLQEQLDTSIALIKLARKYNPDTAIYVIMEGISYMYTETLDTALTMFELALDIEPKNSLANYYIAYVYNSVEYLDSALKYINIAIGYEKNDADYYKLRSGIYYNSSRLTDAMFEIDKALELEPNNEEIILAKAEIYSSLEQYQDVLRIALPYAKKEYNSDFQYYVVIGYYNLGMMDSTMYYIHQAHEQDKTNDLFYYLEGYIYYLAEDYNNAYLSLNAAIELNPDDVEYYYLVCNSKIMINTDSTVLDINENFYDINQNSMAKMIKWSKSKKSQYYYQKLLSKFNYDPTSLSVDEYFMFYYGSALQPGFSGYSNSNPAISKAFENEEYDLCITLGKSFIEDHPASIDSYFYIANSYFMTGNSDLSIKYLTIYYGFLQSIIATGDGDTEETAYIVSSIPDEYTILRYKEYSYAGQSLKEGKKHSYDILYYLDNNVKQEMYFNIDMFFGK